MKHTSLHIILVGFLLSNILWLKAETPLSSTETASSESITISIPAVSISAPDYTLPVNEKEIRAGLLYDVVNQKVVWQKEMDIAYPIASLTKMMVALLAAEDVRLNKFSWDDRVQWMRATTVGRKKNRKTVYSNVNYSLRDVFKASMIASNNECAEKLAIYIGGGSLQSTIDRMNVRAKELGMFNTFFTNPTGLPAPHSMFDNRSSPSDLLKLSLEMLKYNEVVEIAAMGYASIENGSKSNVISNHNKLTIEYAGEVDGLKTGYTRRAGFCLVATAAKCDHRLISIVLGCRGPQIRNEVVRDMINDYYTSISLDKLGNCQVPYATASNSIKKDGVKGRYVTINEKVKKFHVVKKGDNVSTVARKYKVTTAQLRNWNKHALRKNYLYAGQKLLVYQYQPHSIFVQETADTVELEEDKPLLTSSEKSELEKARNEADIKDKPVQNSADQSKYLYHTVAPGDTLFKISQKYSGTTVEDLKQLNKIYDSRFLKPGTRLKIKVQS